MFQEATCTVEETETPVDGESRLRTELRQTEKGKPSLFGP